MDPGQGPCGDNAGHKEGCLGSPGEVAGRARRASGTGSAWPWRRRRRLQRQGLKAAAPFWLPRSALPPLTHQCQLLTLVASARCSTIQRGSPSPHLAISAPKNQLPPPPRPLLSKPSAASSPLEATRSAGTAPPPDFRHRPSFLPSLLLSSPLLSPPLPSTEVPWKRRGYGGESGRRPGLEPGAAAERGKWQ